ncbi:MAG: response regulator [Myxococcales bacterium]|nr:response regulator [Myxococcales bacterium]
MNSDAVPLPPRRNGRDALPEMQPSPFDAQAQARVLVVDDEQVIREILSDFLLMEGYQVLTAENGRAALDVLAENAVHLVLSDLKMPQMGGLELLESIRNEYPEVVTLIMTGYGTVETAIEAMKRGAFDYVLKPFKVEEVVHTVRRGLEQQRLRAENIELRAALSLYQLAARIGDEPDLDRTLSLIVDTVREQTHADRVSVILLPDEDVRWEGASVGEGEPLTEHDLTEAALGLHGAVLANQGRAFRFLRGSDTTAEVTSLLMTPLIGRHKLLGLLLAVRHGGRPFIEGDRKLMTIIADRAAAAVHNAQLFETLERTFRHTIEALVTTLEEKDRYTAGHSARVADFAEITARQMGLDEDFVELIHQAGRLHDIGKMKIRTEELNKPGPLTDEEYERFKMHPVYGEELLGPIPCFREVLPAIGGHHERYDGRGYPRGLEGLKIPLMARIMAVADSYDAMTSHRAYRSALTHEFAVAELKRCSGTQFDPVCVEAFVIAIEVWREARAAAGESYPR